MTYTTNITQLGKVPDVKHYCGSCWQPIRAERERRYTERGQRPLCAACAGEIHNRKYTIGGTQQTL